MKSVLLVQGDARAIPLRDKSVHMVCTSPPFWGLRQYQGVAPSLWGGDPTCQHIWSTVPVRKRGHPGDRSTLIGTQTAHLSKDAGMQGQTCTRCGGWQGTLGNEALHDCLAWARWEVPCAACFVCHLLQVMREVWRVLRDDGTLWLSLGDSMAGSSMAGGVGNGTINGTQHGNRKKHDIRFNAMHKTHLPSKNLCMIPARIALALQADGWVLRSDIIWACPNKMPESVQDRPSRSYEHIFLFAKSPHYFFDAVAIAEPATGGFNGSSFTSAYDRATKSGLGEGERVERMTRNARDVWTFPTSPFAGEHYAAFPPELARRCILAGTSAAGCCPQCQAPWIRQVESHSIALRPHSDSLRGHTPSASRAGGQAQRGSMLASHYTTSWMPACACDTGKPQPCVVFDPCAGSGTTGLVARALGRQAVLCDLSYPYLHDQARHRLQLDAMAAWEGRNGHHAATDYADLPLFGGVTP